MQISSLKYKCPPPGQRSVMLFHEAEIFSFKKKTLLQSVPFLVPLSFTLYCTWRKSESKRQVRLIKWNSIFMWLLVSIPVICQTNLMKKWTFHVYDDAQLNMTVVNFYVTLCYKLTQNSHVYQEYTEKIYRLISFVAVILQRKIASFTLK